MHFRLRSKIRGPKLARNFNREESVSTPNRRGFSVEESLGADSLGRGSAAIIAKPK